MNTAINTPLVSIIIICFNDRKYIGDAIESALMQTYSNCEVIVVDDGSNDGTREYIADCFHDRIKYYWKENGGQGSARSLGLKNASGKYFQNLDSDDLLLPNKIKNQIAYLEAHPDIAFVYGRTLCFFDNDRSHTWEHPANAQACSGNMFKKILQNGNFINNGQPLTCRYWADRIEGFDPSIRDADDYDFMLRLAYAGAEGHFLDEAVYLYRHRHNSSNLSPISARHSEIGQMRGEVYLLKKMYTIMKHDAHLDLVLAKSRLGEACFQLGQALYGQGSRKEALKHLHQGLRFNKDRWIYKLFFLSAATFLPRKQFRKAKKYLKTILKKTKDVE